MKEITVQTHSRFEMIDITEAVQKAARDENIESGIGLVYTPHTTAAITINENADPDVQKDFLRRLDDVYPWNMAEDRHYEGNSAAHLKSSTVGSSQTVIIRNGKLLLGQWQGIYFCEFDGPRARTCFVKII